MAGSFNDTELAKVVGEINQVDMDALNNKEAVLLNLIEQGEVKEINERGANIIVEVYPNPQFNAFGSGGKYANPGSLTRIKMNVPIKRLSHPTRFDRDAIEAGGKEDLVDVVASHMESDVSMFAHEMNQQCYQDGNGVKAVIDTGSSGTSLIGTFPYGVDQILETGEYQIYTSAGVARGASEIYTIQSRVIETRTATTNVSLAVGGAGGAVAAGDVVTHPNSWGKNIQGLLNIVSTSTATLFQNQSRATYPMLKSRVDSNGGILRNLSVALFERNFGRIKYARGVKPKGVGTHVIISSPTQWNAYSAIAHSAGAGGSEIKRFPDVTKILDLGYEVHQFAGKTWIEDTDCSDYDVFGLDLSKIKKYEYKKMGLRPGGGANGLFPIYALDSTGAGTMVDADMWTLTWKGNLGSPDPGRLVRITDLESAGFANRIGN